MCPMIKVYIKHTNWFAAVYRSFERKDDPSKICYVWIHIKYIFFFAEDSSSFKTCFYIWSFKVEQSKEYREKQKIPTLLSQKRLIILRRTSISNNTYLTYKYIILHKAPQNTHRTLITVIHIYRSDLTGTSCLLWLFILMNRNVWSLKIIVVSLGMVR